ncbi:MAG: hypothetical protein H0W82_02255 [Actinobacteria bacterium]|nr:hypothetical protein [Actinomycetota bacterium]
MAEYRSASRLAQDAAIRRGDLSPWQRTTLFRLYNADGVPRSEAFLVDRRMTDVLPRLVALGFCELSPESGPWPLYLITDAGIAEAERRWPPNGRIVA